MKTVDFGKEEKKAPLAQAIAAHRFAADMKPDYVKRLASAGMFKQFEPEDIIFKEAEPANRFYLIQKGKIALEYRGDGELAPLIQYIGQDEVLGWSWLFPPYYWRFTARVVEPVDAIFFYGTRLREQCEDDPAFGYDLMKRVAAIVIKRLQMTRVQLIDLQQRSRLDIQPKQ